MLSIADYVQAIADILGQEAKIVFAPWSWIRQQPDLSDFEAPFVNERFVPDIAQVKRDLKFEPTPLGIWLKQTVAWFLNDYNGPDSHGYTKRAAEIAAARRLRSTGNAAA
ncbi:hypothetical protein [Thermoflexus sp.]|uniref:hypothetical protein n=1 Tax=Thermoflexus sp. TaxID=1969742 RepID=UPI0035E4142A